MWLKAELHSHSMGDPEDDIKHTSRDLIEHAAKLDYQVLAITWHRTRIDIESDDLAAFAAERGILLIPGAEAVVEGKDVLIYNFPHTQFESFAHLKSEKREDNLVIAPHPFYPGLRCVWNKLYKHKDAFDAVEYCHFYANGANPFNPLAKKASKRLNLPLVGTSDVHRLWQLGQTYTMIEAERKDLLSVFAAIRNHKVKLVTRPIPWNVLVRETLKIVTGRYGSARIGKDEG
jgi:predicted metal-dependent phosphoesterase TrpH